MHACIYTFVHIYSWALKSGQRLSSVGSTRNASCFDPTVKAGKLEDGLPRLAHGARHLPTLSLAVYVTFVPNFMFSNFGAQNVVLQVLPHSETRPTFLLHALGEIQKQPGAPRNRFRSSTGSSRTHRTAFRTTPKMPCPKYWRDSASLSRKYWQYLNTVITMPTMRFPNYWRESETVLGTAESLSPLINTGISRFHRTASRTTPKMLCPKY